MQDQKPRVLNLNTVADRLKSEITVTAPGWVFAGSGLLTIVLLIAALD
ncbi:MAG: hypothetical protein AAF729_11850 [Pseudomonadota bacterium]